MSKEYFFSLVQSTSIAAKTFNQFGQKGKFVHPYEGVILKVMITSMLDLKQWMEYLYSRPYEFLIIGITGYETVPFASKKNLVSARIKDPVTITKSDEYLSYATKTIWFIDYDFVPMFPLYTYQELVQLIEQLIPETIGCAKLVKFSSSAHVKWVETNQYLSNKISMHMFLFISNVTQERMDKLKMLLKKAMVFHGYVGNDNREKVSILDESSFSKQKPIFTGCPLMADTLIKEYYEPMVFDADGGALDLAEIGFDRYGDVGESVNYTKASFIDTTAIDTGSYQYFEELGMGFSEVTIANLKYLQSLKVKKMELYKVIKPYLNSEITVFILKYCNFEFNSQGYFKLRPSERTASCSILDNGFIKDFGSDFKGDIFKVIETFYDIGFKESLCFVADSLGVQYE